MDALLDQVRDVAEGQIVRLCTSHRINCEAIATWTNSAQDFAGQKLADTISTTMLAAFSVSICEEAVLSALT